jgi:hypothetical protein
MPDLAAWIGNSTQVSGVPQRVEDQGTLMDAARMISASTPRRLVALRIPRGERSASDWLVSLAVS